MHVFILILLYLSIHLNFFLLETFTLYSYNSKLYTRTGYKRETSRGTWPVTCRDGTRHMNGFGMYWDEPNDDPNDEPKAQSRVVEL